METIREAISRLEGTCNEPFDPTLYSNEDLAILDDEIFMCTTCNWWCWIDELSPSDDGELTCNDCYNEE